MSEQKRSLFHHAVIYWLGRMLARSVSIILLPIYTAYISPSEYGLLSILGMIMNFLMLVLSFQLPTAIYRFWPQQESQTRKNVLLSTSFIFMLVVPTLVLLPIYIWVEPIASLLDASSDPNLLRLVLFQVQVGMIWLLLQTDMRVHDASKTFALSEIAQNVFVGLLSIVLVAYVGWGITGMIISQTFGFCIITVYWMPKFVKRVSFTFDLAVARKMVFFSFPLVPAAVAMAAVHSADLFFLQRMIGFSETGIYSIGYKFGMLVNFLVGAPFVLIWQPRSFQIAEDADAPVQFGHMFTYLAIGLCVVAIALSGLANEIVQVMTAQDYQGAATVIPFVAWSYVFFAFVSITNIGLLVYHKTKLIALIIMIVFVTNMVANYVLIPYYGIIGAALATLLSFILHFFLTLYCSYRYIPIKFEIKKLIKLFFLSIICFSFLFTINFNDLLINISLKFVVLCFYVLALFGVGFFSKLRLNVYVSSIFRR